MMKARLQYFVKDRKSFEDKVLPYVFGGGVFYKEIDANTTFGQNKLSVIIETKTLSQLVTASAGMLRYSPGSVLEKIDLVQTDMVVSKTSEELKVERPLLGVIIKPSLTYKPEIARNILKSAGKVKVDFVKDDDASEYSKEEAEEIKKLANNVPYFQKISDSRELIY